MSISRKGKRRITVEEITYLWYVKEDDESGGIVLTVIGNDSIFLRRTFENGGNISITPSVVCQEILRELDYHEKRKALSALPSAESPDGWVKIADISEGIPDGIGLDPDKDILLAAFYPQKGELPLGTVVIRLYSLESCTEFACEAADGRQIDRRQGFCLGIGPLAGRKIPYAKWFEPFLPFVNVWGDKLYQPPFSPADIYYQPAGKDILNPENNKGCVRVWHGSYAHSGFGFSASGNYFVIVRDEEISVWRKLDRGIKNDFML